MAQQQPPPSAVHVSEFAVQRIRDLKGEDGRGPLFTSDLSVNEFMVLKKSGFHPLGLVIGSSVYHVGYQPTGWTVSQEMTVLSQAMYTARELAMTRMEYEASQLGADGIVGVRLEVARYSWADDQLEFMCVGTAVKAEDGSNWRTKAGRPFTSDLSGQDFAVLLSTGFAPVGLVLGACVYHVAHMTFRQMLKTSGMNTEMANFTQALYDAREIAMLRMQIEAKGLGADGIVGVTMKEASHLWESHVIEFLSVGTAISKRGDVRPTPSLVLDVSK